MYSPKKLLVYIVLINELKIDHLVIITSSYSHIIYIGYLYSWPTYQNCKTGNVISNFLLSV